MDLSEIEKQTKEYEESKRVVVYADEKTAQRLRIKVGEPYTIFPLPTTKEEAFERLEKLTAPTYFLTCARDFKRSFPINLRTLTDELKELNKFIEEAEKISIKEAFDVTKINLNNAEKHEYLRWKYEYYKNDKIEFTSSQNFYSSALITAYGKYILYKRWIEEEIELLKQNNKETSISSGKNVLSSDSDLFDILNKTLAYYRDLGSYEQPINVFDKIDKPEYTDSAVIDIVIHKLRKDNYLLEAPIDSFEIGYCISADGILFINSGGYTTNTEIKIEPIKQIDIPKIENPYPQIFTDYNAYKLFDKLHNEFKDNSKYLADYSFIYRMMYKDGFIFSNYRPEMFKDWLSKEPYSIYLDLKLKTLNNCTTPNKVSIYNTLKQNVPLGI